MHGNELLDFVMSLVRDPDAAARYADDPQQAIADAHLTDVTSVDVNNLIPVVSESMSMAAPALGMPMRLRRQRVGERRGDGRVRRVLRTRAGACSRRHPGHAGGPAAIAPLDSRIDQFGDSGPDLRTFDAGTLDQPLVAPEVHDVGPAADPAPFDPGFGHVDDHHGFADPGVGPDPHGFDDPLIWREKP